MKALTGFLSSGDEHLKGNYGLEDQLAAIRWIRDNADAFRADPSRVTAFGHSAGSAMVGMMLVMPSARGLVHRVIAQVRRHSNNVGGKSMTSLERLGDRQLRLPRWKGIFLQVVFDRSWSSL